MRRILTTCFFSLVCTSALAQTPATTPTTPAPAAPRAGGETFPEIELQRALDKPFNLTLQKVELSEAFKQIAATAQIALQVDPACYDLLPYGATTRVSADFRQSKLRDAIEEVLVPLSLQQTISGGAAGGSGAAPAVIIRPSAPLARIGRRADWDELKLLQDLRTSNDLKLAPNAPFDFTALLRAAIDTRPNLVVSIVGPGNANEPGPNGSAHEKAVEQLRKQLPISAFRALELYCQYTNQIWFVETGSASGSPAAGTTGAGGGGTVRIMPQRRWIERQLERPIQVSFTNAPLDQVIAELSHLSGIHFTPEPGLYQAVPAVILNSNNDSVIHTLEALSGGARIAFDIRDDSIFLRMAGNPQPKVDPIVARISVPIGSSSAMSMDVLVHESDLPPELNDLRKTKIKESLEALRATWTPAPTVPPSPAPAPTTQPATQTDAK